MMIHRRRLLTGLGAAIAAPAVVRAASLMPVRASRRLPIGDGPLGGITLYFDDENNLLVHGDGTPFRAADLQAGAWMTLVLPPAGNVGALTWRDGIMGFGP